MWSCRRWGLDQLSQDFLIRQSSIATTDNHGQPNTRYLKPLITTSLIISFWLCHCTRTWTLICLLLNQDLTFLSSSAVNQSIIDTLIPFITLPYFQSWSCPSIGASPCLIIKKPSLTFLRFKELALHLARNNLNSTQNYSTERLGFTISKHLLASLQLVNYSLTNSFSHDQSQFVSERNLLGVVKEERRTEWQQFWK